MAGKPRDAFSEEQKRRKQEADKYYRRLREKQVRQRLGLSRKKQQLVIDGLPMAFTASPEIVRERWFRVPAVFEYGRRIRKGRTYCFTIWRYSLRSADGRRWTALQAQCHDAHHGWMLNVTGFWGLKELNHV